MKFSPVLPDFKHVYFVNLDLPTTCFHVFENIKLGLRPRRKVEHWTPKGGSKVTGNKERNSKFRPKRS